MLRLTQRFIRKSLSLTFVSQQRVLVNLKDHHTVFNFPNLTSAAFYSKDVKVESPLSKLLLQDKPKEEHIAEPVEEQEKKETREQSWRRMKLTLMVFGVSFLGFGGYLIVTLGQPKVDEDGVVLDDPFINMPVVKQYVLRTLSELNYYQQLIREPSRDKLLPDMMQHPYYSPQYTLVLEFTDLLVHPEWTYQTGWRFKKRPGLDHFLESLSGTFEIVVYTAEQGMTVFPIIEHLDPKNHINYKLVRDATLFIDGKHVKDIGKLNRDLKRTIVVDWDGQSTKYHPDNVFAIPRWRGNDDDLTLVHLSSFLSAIAQNQIEDVREVVRYYNTFDDPLMEFREKQKKLIDMAEEDALAKSKQKDQTSPVKKWTPSFWKR